MRWWSMTSRPARAWNPTRSGKAWPISGTPSGPITERLLAERESLQAQIDRWHRDHKGQGFDATAYEVFLRDIGYLHPEPAPFSITTDNVDPEIAQIAGPQLVVPVMNARYALNAANARWGSLYDALYGTDVIPTDGGAERGGAYNPIVASGSSPGQEISWIRTAPSPVALTTGVELSD